MYRYIILSTLFLAAFCLSSHAQEFESTQIYKPPLTKEQVRQFMKTRLAIGQLQKQIIANQSAQSQIGSDQIKAFYKKRDALIKNHGWEVKKFEQVETRISTAMTAMQQYKRHKQADKTHKEKVAKYSYNKQEQETLKALEESIVNIQNSNLLSLKEKEEIIKGLKIQQQQIKGSGSKLAEYEENYLELQQERITENQEDWPAVRPYLDKLQHITDWYNGNRPDIPSLN